MWKNILSRCRQEDIHNIKTIKEGETRKSIAFVTIIGDGYRDLNN